VLTNSDFHTPGEARNFLSHPKPRASRCLAAGPTQHDVATVHLPRVRSLIKHSLPHLVEGTLLPVLVFYAALFLTSVWGALVAALAWSYGAMAYRIARGERVSGMLVITALTLTLRTGVAFASGSVVVYFLQPAIAKVALAAAFVVTMRRSEPLIQRLFSDFVPMPAHLLERPGIRRLFLRLSYLWAALLVLHAGIGLWLLLSHSVATYVAVKTVLNIVVKGSAVLLSIVAARRAIQNLGLKVVLT
jgi:intracellular septation protein A